jgi:uncharacterized protein (DUF1499 family)
MESQIARSSDPLPPCPAWPNCVSSLAPDPCHRVKPLAFAGPAEAAAARLRAAILAQPRARIVAETERTGHRAHPGENPVEIQAEFRSRLFGFVDDLVCLVCRAGDGGMVHVRSAARQGKWDFGVNRKRIERIRRAFETGCPGGKA